MTTEEKAKAYEMALEAAREELKQDLHESGVWAIKRIFPELRESEDERIIKTIEYILYENYTDAAVIQGVEIAEIVTWLEKQKVNTDGDFARGYDCGYECCLNSHGAEWFEKQKEIPMPNSTELIEMWHAEKAMLKEKDFRGDEWRLAQNAFIDGFAKGTCVKFDKWKEPHYTKRNALFDKCVENCDPEVMKEVSDKVDEMLGKEQKEPLTPLAEALSNFLKNDFEFFARKEWNEAKWNEVMNTQATELQRLAYLEKQKEQKPKPNYCHYGGDPNIERCKYCSAACIGRLAEEQKPVEWNDTDMKEARENLITCCRDWERGEQTTLLPIVAVRARYFLEQYIKPPAEWSDEDENAITTAIRACRYMTENFENSTKQYEDAIDWLKSIRPQLKVEWSEEDENKMDVIIRLVEQGSGWPDRAIKEYVNWLKSLRPSWKPSEEQIKALESCFCEFGEGCPDEDGLRSLYNDLKKLIKDKK